MYVREFFDDSARKSVREMVQEMKNVFNEIIDEVDWMDDKTRIRVKEKVAAMTTYIALLVKTLKTQKFFGLIILSIFF